MSFMRNVCIDVEQIRTASPVKTAHVDPGHQQVVERGQPQKSHQASAEDEPGRREKNPGTSQSKRASSSDIKARLARLTQKDCISKLPLPSTVVPSSTAEQNVPANAAVPGRRDDHKNPSAEVSKVSVETPEEHPYAALFPMVQGDEMRELAENIKTNRLLDPIVRYQGKILDGRQRLAACKLAGVEPRFVEFEGDNAAAVQFVLAKNIHRRNLTKSQRAAIAADLLVLYEKQAAERKRLLSGTRKNPNGTTPAKKVPEKIPGPAGEAREQVAKLLDVNARYVSTAKEVREADPELHEQVRAGKRTLHAAKKQLSSKTGIPRDSDQSNSANVGREAVARHSESPQKREKGFPAEEPAEPVQSSAESTGDTAKSRPDRKSGAAAQETVQSANSPTKAEDGFNPKSRWQQFRDVLEGEYANWPETFHNIFVHNLRSTIAAWETSASQPVQAVEAKAEPEVAPD